MILEEQKEMVKSLGRGRAHWTVENKLVGPTIFFFFYFVFNEINKNTYQFYLFIYLF